MKLSFDKFERYEMPQVTLCNPNSRATEVDGKTTITDTVGVLSNPKGMSLKLNFNAPHELSFDYYRHKSTDPIKQSFYDKIYEAIQTDRYVYLTDIGYFIISNVSDSDEDNIDKKSITCKSCEENEFAVAEGLNLDEKTYYLHTENNDGLLDLFLPKTAGWTIGFIDPSLLEKPYYVEKTEVDNGYNFLYTTIQDMFECIVEPDIIKRTVSVYSRAYYAEHHLTDIHIAKYNLLKHKIVEENDEDKYTALNVQGKDENLEIRTVNPTGTNVIYNFESRYSWMSPALQDAVERWQDKCESVEEEYFTLQQGYYNDMQNIVFPLEQDIKVLELQLKQQQQTRDLIVIGEQDKAIDIVESLPQTGKSDVLYFIPITENNYKEYVWENNSWKYIDLIRVDDISDTNQQRALDLVNAAINNTNIALSEKQSMLEDEQNKIQTNYSERIDQINAECALETTSIFTTELRNELMTHIKPTDYVDEYMLVTESMTYPQRFEKAKELMERAKSQLVKISSGKKTYSVDTRSFLFNKHFKHFSEQLCAGAIIYVETKKDIMEQLHLTGIDINFDDKSTSFTLGNKYDRSDLKALYEDTLGQHSKSFSELKYIASIIEDQQKELDYQRNWVADLRTLTLDNVLTSEDQAIEINNRGLIGRKRQVNADGSWKEDKNGNPLFELEQVKLINNTLVFTEDNWNTASTAVGKIAVGYDDKGNVKYSYGINGQVLIGELILGNNLVLTGTSAGIKIKDSSGNNVFYADENGNLNLTGNIVATSLDLVGCTIDSTKISGLSSVATSGNYNDLTGKPTIPTSVAELGLDTNKIIYKENITQQSKQDSNGVWYMETTVPTASGNITYSTYDADQYIVLGRSFGNDVEGQKYICIDKEGALTARNAVIYGTIYATDGSFTGTVTASSGTIGGWTIGKNALYKDCKSNEAKYRVYMQAPSDVTSTTSAFAVKEDKNGVNTWPFYVKYDGSIHASKGTVGGYTIGENSLKGTNMVIYSGDSNSGAVIEVGNGNINLYKDGIIEGNIINGRMVESQQFYVSDSSGNAQMWYNNNALKFKSSDSDYMFLCNNSDVLLRFWYNSGTQVQFRESLTFYRRGNYPNPILGIDNTGGWLHGKWYIDQSFSGSGSAITSDANKKHEIVNLSSKYSVLFDNLRPVTYKYNDGTSNRLHTGFIAQEVNDALNVSEISTQDFAGLIIDKPNTNEEGWYLRYEEFVALNTWEIQKLKKKAIDLENTVAELKTQLQTLTAG